MDRRVDICRSAARDDGLDGLKAKRAGSTVSIVRIADAALAVWLEMWNTDTEIARRICSGDSRIHFLISETDGSKPGDDVLGAESFARFLERYREMHPDVVFTEAGEVFPERDPAVLDTDLSRRRTRRLG